MEGTLKTSLVLLLLALLACHPDAPSPSPAPIAAPSPPAAEAPAPPPEAPEPEVAPAPAAAPEPAPTGLPEIRTLLRAGRRARAIEGLRAGLQRGQYKGEALTTARYLLGRSLAQEGDPAAVEALSQLPAPWPEAEDRRLLWLGRALLLADRDEEGVKALGAALKANPEMAEAGRVTIQIAQAQQRLGRPKEAIKTLERLKTRSREQQAEALRLRVEWLMPTDAAQARRLARQLILTLPEAEAAQRPGLPVQVEDLSPEERWRRARLLNDRWAYEEARRELRRFVEDPKRGDDAAWEVAYISLRRLRDDPEEARALLQRVIKNDPKRREEGTFLLMRTYLQQDRYEDTLRIIERYEREFPRGAHRADMAYYRAWMPYDQGDCKKALPLLKGYIRQHGEKRSIVMGFHAWCLIRLERWEEAIADFGEMIPAGNPVVRGKAHYWRAWSMSKLGRKEEALAELATLRRVYPLTYYDMLGQQLAARLEGRDPRASSLPWPAGGGDAHLRHPMPEDAWSWPVLKGAQAQGLARVRRWVELDEVDRARAAWGPLREGVEAAVPAGRRLAFVRFMGHQVEDYRRGWQEVTGGNLAAMTQMPDAGDLRWLLAYPQAYAPLVEALGEEFGLPAHFVYSIMRQESRYNPSAVSNTNAVGALQMIPQTARRVAAQMGVTYNLEEFPRPQVSFPYSFFYIKKHFDFFQGQLVPTAASYNGGPEPIARWMRQQAGAPLDRLIEEFAYNESRIYCRKVAEHMLRYLYLYEPDAGARGRWLDALFPVEVSYALPDEIDY
jgi:soluble lytic murein transglycosylase